jgi:hypothetical protein
MSQIHLIQLKSNNSLKPSPQSSIHKFRQPSSQPTRQPSSQPSSQPFSKPSGQPSTQPSIQPPQLVTNTPSSQPTTQPSSRPSNKQNIIVNIPLGVCQDFVVLAGTAVSFDSVQTTLYTGKLGVSPGTAISGNQYMYTFIYLYTYVFIRLCI